ncbi:uncharacterized protein LOC123638766 [Lemur catta]|uniref:uncharacterized protein LOC123638766 n=1 Tax=Lemur catta TaxID=9447 RepID=UPI001E266912|nr:uncharacterized protein LOC123638766 [Lemur catta]
MDIEGTSSPDSPGGFHWNWALSQSLPAPGSSGAFLGKPGDRTAQLLMAAECDKSALGFGKGITVLSHSSPQIQRSSQIQGQGREHNSRRLGMTLKLGWAGELAEMFPLSKVAHLELVTKKSNIKPEYVIQLLNKSCYKEIKLPCVYITAVALGNSEILRAAACTSSLRGEPGWEEEGKPQNSRKIGPAGGGQKFPSALHSWAAERAPAAGPASDAPGLLPVLVTAPGADPPPPARDAGSLHTDGSHESTYPVNGRAREQYAPAPTRPRPPSLPAPPSGGRRDRYREPGTRKGEGLPAAPSQPAPSSREDQSPQSRARRMLPPSSAERDNPARAPQTGTPERTPPDTLRQRRAGGRRHLRASRPERDSKVCRRKVSPPTWGGGCRGREGGRWRAALGRCFWPAVSAPSESRRCWLKINSAARVGPDSWARTANMDAHQVLLARRCGSRGGSRRELVGRAGGSGRGKERRKGGGEEEEERPGTA